jgi:hypothetical protein
MTTFNVIEFHRTRDFSRKLNATFEFIKQNFKPLSKSILLIAGPPILVASVIMGSFMSDFNVFSRTASAGQITDVESYFTSVTFWLEIVLMVIFYTVASVMNIATVNNYLLLYGEKRSNTIEVSEVWARVRATFWMYFRSVFLFMLLLVATYIVLMIPMLVLVAISPFLMFFGVLFLLVAVIYLIFAASLTFIIRAYENNGFFEAVVRSFKLVKDKWWSTFGLLMILYLIMAVASYIFIFPWYVISGISMFHSLSTNTIEEPSSSWQLVTTVVFAMYYLVQMVLAALPNIGIAFQYFNLVEMKEAKGLLTQIETLGQPAASAPSQDEHY